MDAATDTRDVRRFLAQARRRLRRIAAARGAAAGLAVALAAVLVMPARTLPGLLLLAGGGAAAGAGTALLRRRGTNPASVVERRAPGCRNVVITAAELLDEPERVRPYIGAAVAAEAARTVRGLDVRVLFPARGAAAAAMAGVAAWALALTLMAARPDVLPAITPFAAEPHGILHVDVTVTPPSYTGAQAHTLRDPDHIEALAGSRIGVTVRANAAAVTLETVAGRQALDAGTARTFTGALVADADGFLAIETADTGAAPVRRLMGLRVVPDEPPRVRITEPGRDLVFPDGDRAIDVALEAADDHGLASLRMTFTRVTGFGEQFTFTDGDVPLELTRTDARRWTGRARWPLAGLALEPGDMIVYRGIATDRRPGAPPGESDTWMIEVHAAGAVVSGGFAIDEELDRYALSQQMVIVLTERLLARRASLPESAFMTEVQALAAAQRRVRAEFVFMLGGELEDTEHLDDAEMLQLHEEAHARADEEMAEGRLANQGRIELTRAIQYMSRALSALELAQVDTALTAEQSALVHLQRAFSRTRYILRTLSERERLDLSRRLTGALGAVARDTRPRVEPVSDPRLTALRRALADAAALAAAPTPDADAAGRASRLAQGLLRMDAGAGPLREAAASLSAAADAMMQDRPDDARGLLSDVVVRLTTLVRDELAAAPRGTPALDIGRLDGALTDALRGR